MSGRREDGLSGEVYITLSAANKTAECVNKLQKNIVKSDLM
jgi:hypothetical protein